MYLPRKHRLVILSAIAIATAFFFTRLYNILELPIFTDEAIYLRWAQIAKNDANWRFISLTDGKQPLLIWFTMIAMRVVTDPLLAGRIVSVFAGFASMIGLFFLGREFFQNRWIGMLAAGLYALYPFALVYDRMALYDGLVGTFAVWSLYIAILLVRKLRLDIALVLGMLLGGAVLNKTSGFISAYLLPFSIILFDFSTKRWRRRFVHWVILAVVSVTLMYMYYSVLRLSPFFHIIDEKNMIFYYPLAQWLQHPFTNFLSNWKGLFNWFITYLTWPILFLVVGAFFFDRKFTKEKLLLILWFLIPFTVLAFIGKTLYPRFIFFMTLPLLALAALSLWKLNALIKNKVLLVTCCLLLVALMLRADYFILTNFENAPIPRSDLDQYVNDWPAGGGVKEAVDFFKQEAKKGKIYIGTQGTFGLMPYALELYLVDNPNVTLVGFWPLDNEPPEEVVKASSGMPTYFLFYQPCAPCANVGEAPPLWNATRMFAVKKGAGERYLTVYKIISE